MNKKTYTTHSPQETQEIAAGLARSVLSMQYNCAKIVTLAGDLGAGKTTFAQGFLGALGADGPFTSPTFTIMKLYEVGKWQVYHIDPYRITTDDVVALGWKEMVADKDVIILLEWPEIVATLVPDDAITVKFSHVDECTRKITVNKNFV